MLRHAETLVQLVEHGRFFRYLSGDRASQGPEWESGYRAISQAKAQGLVGAQIYFHERQIEPSYYGGEITGFRVQADGEFAGRVVFRFIRKAECRDIRAGADGWRYEKKLVRYSCRTQLPKRGLTPFTIMPCSRSRERHNSVNKPEHSGVALEQALAEKLREILKSASWLSSSRIERLREPLGAGFDLKATLPVTSGPSVELWIQCKSDPRPSKFPYIAVQSGSFSPSGRTHLPVFAAPYVSPNMARICEENGWGWFDLAGNCRLEIPGALLLERKGNAPVHEPPRPAANLSSPESARVIRALLVPENSGKRWTQREMQLHCQPNVSLGLVNKVVRYLRDEALLESGDGGFGVRDPLKLLFAWRDAYRFERHHQRRYFTLKRGPELKQALSSLESITGGHAAYCAFSAADFQAPHVRQPRVWLFVDPKNEEECAHRLGAKLVETGENLIVLIPEDLGVFYQQESDGEHLACTNPVQTYVDLWHSGNRGQEAAEALLEQNLKPEWKTRGLA